MKKSYLSLLLLMLLVVIQFPLWVGKGGWFDVWNLQREIVAQKEHNRQLEVEKISLEAQVIDLKDGYEALEELARSELGMIRRGELFYQVVGDDKVIIDGEH